jgi:hypothetical protein
MILKNRYCGCGHKQRTFRGIYWEMSYECPFHALALIADYQQPMKVAPSLSTESPAIDVGCMDINITTSA